MKILLIRPKMANTLGFLNIVDCEPLELEYLYTVAKQEKFSCSIYDAMYENKDLMNVLKEEQPDIVSISGYITQENLMIKYSKKIKEYNENIIVIVGGVHVELNAEKFYQNTIDYIVHTSSLNIFRKLINNIKNNKVDSISKLDGICYKKNNDWVKNNAIYSSEDEWITPDRSFFNTTKDRYRYLEFQPCALLKTSYSCPYKCNFCYCRKLNCGKYMTRDIEEVVKEIESIECESIYIVDDDFLVDNKRVKEFIELLKKKNIKKNYLIYGRADYVSNDKNKEMLLGLKEIGVKYIMVGLEATTTEQLNSYNKLVDINQNEKCIEVLKECGIKLMALLMVNLDFSKEDFKNMTNWIKKTGLSYVTVSIFTPLPGTDIYSEYEEKIENNKVEKYDFLHVLIKPSKMSKREFYMEYYKLFLLVYKIAKKNNQYEFLNLEYIKTVFEKFIRNVMKT